MYQRVLVVSAVEGGASIREAARRAGVSPKAAHTWVTRFKAERSLAEKKRSGRKKAVSTAAAVRAKELLLSEEHHGATSVARALHEEGFTAKQLHPSTIIRAAVRQAERDGDPIRARRGRPAKGLTMGTKAKRLAFALANKARSWANVLFTDRKKFIFLYPGCSVKRVQWCRKGQTRQAAAVNHPMCVNVYAGISPHGVTACHVVAGTSKHTSKYCNKKGAPAKNITAAEYKDVLLTTLLPQGQAMFSKAGVSNWQLQQDNDPSHRGAADTFSTYRQQFGSSVELLPNWPPSSPDLNLIENVWAWVDAELHKRGYKSFEEFRQGVLDTIRAVPKSMLTKLYASMPNRVATVIARNGDKSGY